MKFHLHTVPADPKGGRKYLNISEEEMEWIFNSLRFMQEHQLAEAQRMAEEGSSLEHNLGDEVPVEERSVSLHAMFRDNYTVITNFREKLVELVGHDLTDG